MDSPKLGEKTPRMQQGKWSKLQHTSSEIEPGEEEESSPAQILERVKPDRVTASKPEEDRRRRTIIVEKKNGSFGFTLQSYGIHYKKEQEIEMITYVDYVDYDGAAFRAGMREGDVILSINGHDMEKADHKALVNFIKNCETRMRMVVLFEDCVRKVELHMRYIQLQRVLQGKMAELERLCLRERDLLQGKWKTHSLPARKKATASTSTDGAIEPDNEDSVDYNHCRPTVSTEDVGRVPTLAPTQQLLLAYQYLDPRYRAYFIHPAPGSSSNEYLCQQLRGRHESNHRVSPESQVLRHGAAKGYHQTNGMAAAGPGVKSNAKSSNSKPTPSHQLCNPCIQASNQDNSSLDAYDLASPCCNPHCVPSARRRARHQKNKAKNAQMQQEEESKGWKETKSGRSTQIPNSNSHPPPPPQRSHRYFNFGTGLVSQCSLHSCTSSELSCNNPHGSGASYTTSLSNDTLYWDVDGPQQAGSSHAGNSTSSKQGVYDQYQAQHHPQSQHQYPSTSQFTSYNPAKPAKSWDNLTTKAFGGYGFGYGYLDTTSSKAAAVAKGSHNRTHSTKASTNGNQQNHNGERRIQGAAVATLFNRSQHHTRYVQPTKSTESLLLLPKYNDSTLSDSSLSCECLDATSPTVEGAAVPAHFFPVVNTSVSTSAEQNMSNLYLVQQGRSQGSQTEGKRNVQEGPEITRL